MFRSPLQRLAHRLHLAGQSEAPLGDTEMELAMQLNAGVGMASGAVAAFAGASAITVLGTFALVTVLFTAALWHRVLFWVPLVAGSALAIGIGAFFGWAAPTATAKALWLGGGIAVAALTYGRLIFRKLRRRAK